MATMLTEERELRYDAEVEAEVREAMREFDRQIDLGRLAVRETDGGKKEQIHEFDPEAETIHFLSPLKGG